MFQAPAFAACDATRPSDEQAPDGLILTESQVQALEKAKEEHETIGEFEREHPGYRGGQDTFYVSTLARFQLAERRYGR